MAAVLGPDLDVRRVLGPLGEELAGERASDVFLAAACRAVEQVRVRGRVLQRRPEDGFGVGVGGEVEHVPLILGSGPRRTAGIEDGGPDRRGGADDSPPVNVCRPPMPSVLSDWRAMLITVEGFERRRRDDL